MTNGQPGDLAHQRLSLYSPVVWKWFVDKRKIYQDIDLLEIRVLAILRILHY